MNVGAATKYVNSYKIVLIGDCNVGKTAIVERLSSNTFSEQYKPTVGTGHTYWSTSINGTVVDIQLWDTAGEERFATLAPIYYKDSSAAIIVYSQDEPQSAANVIKWYQRFNDAVPDNPPVCVLCNKIDLGDTQDFDLSEISVKNQCLFRKTSAKSGSGIVDAFTALVAKILEREKSIQHGDRNLNIANKKSGCC